LPLWPNDTNVYSNLMLRVKTVYTLVDPNKTIYSSQSEKCCICMENPNEIIFNPCYHFDTCIKCAEQLSSKCPICRTRIISLIKTLPFAWALLTTSLSETRNMFVGGREEVVQNITRGINLLYRRTSKRLYVQNFPYGMIEFVYRMPA